MSEQVYREQGKATQEVVCPSCKRSVIADSERTATCSHCDQRFAISTELAPRGEFRVAQKNWRPVMLASGVLAMFAMLALQWGLWGVAVGFVIALVAMIAETARKL